LRALSLSLLEQLSPNQCRTNADDVEWSIPPPAKPGRPPVRRSWAPLAAWSRRALQMSTPIRDLHRVPHQGQTEQSSEMRSHPSTAPGNSSFRGVRSTPVRKASFGRRKCGLPACLPWGSFGEPPLLAFVGKSVLGVSPGEGGGFLLVRPSVRRSNGPGLWSDHQSVPSSSSPSRHHFPLHRSTFHFPALRKAATTTAPAAPLD
jgi:hypothetical protein